MATTEALRAEKLSMADYRAADAVSKSDLDLIHRSPAHYRQEKDFPSPPTPAMVWGTMFHTFILEPDVFEAQYAVLPLGIDRRTKEGRAAWDEWQEANAGKTPIDKPTLAELTAMRDSLHANPYASAALTGGSPELCFFWDDVVPCKCRPDMVNRGLIIDLKTTTDARPDRFARSCWEFRYHVQAGFYSYGFERVNGCQPEEFLFIAVEKSPPYAVAIYRASAAFREQGLREARSDLAVYAECLERDCWPGYPEMVQDIELPYWAQEER